MSRFAYKEEFDEILVSYFIKQHTDDLKSILSAKDVEKHYAVVIEAALLFDVCIELRGLLLNNPVKVLPRFDAMLRKAANLVFDEQSMEEMSLKDHLHARITGLVFYPELNRSVIPKSGDVGLFVSISGTIVRASLVQLLQSEKRYTCNSCKHVFSVKNDHEQFNKIRGHLRCPNPDSCTSTKFSQTIDADQWRDYQEVKIQERVQALSIRVIPRTISVVLEDDLVDSCKPGDDVTVVGVMCRRWRSCSENTRCHVQHVIIANHIQVNNQRCHSRITTNMQTYFSDFWSEYKERPLQGRNEIIQSLCPQIYGLFQIKLAVALILAGGVAKSDESGTRIRGESHMLLIGDPGTGKSQFLKYAAKITPRSVFTTGVGSTSAGLTVSAVKDSGQWNLEAGALVLADGGLCCIDEFNSIKENDKSSILEAMEQQTISVAKAGLVCKMNARCTILAATNPKGHYDQNMVASINVAIPSPLLSRFDLIYVMLDTKSDDWDRLVSNYVLHGIQPLVNSSHKMSMSKMQSYFSLVKQLKPSLSTDANSILQQYYLAHRKSDDRNVTRTTVRLLESMVRLSEAHAKLMFRSEVLIMDAIVAVVVMESSLGCLGLLGPENILHTNFPPNPDQLYESQGEIILKKFGLEDIWEKEQQRLHSVNDNGFGTSNSLALITGASSDGRDEGYISTTIEPIEEKLATVNNFQNEPPELSLSSECTKTPNLTKDVEAPKSLLSLRTIKKLEKFAFVVNDDRSSPAKTTSDAERNIFGNGELMTSTPKYAEMPKLAHNSQENLKQEKRLLADSGIGHQNSRTIVPNTIRPSNSAEIEGLCEINESDLTLDWL